MSKSSRTRKKTGKLKAEEEVARTKEQLRKELQANTRAACDPFLSNQAASTSSTLSLGIKRKRDGGTNSDALAVDVSRTVDEVKPPLVDYDSD